MSVTNPATRPAAHWDATFDELLSTGATKTWTLHIGDSFTDTPESNSFYRYVETIFHVGITGGCGAGIYCPGNGVTRAQMAVFILKAEHGASYAPPPCTGLFTDVECAPTPAFAVDWIEELFNEGITGGCGVGLLLPEQPGHAGADGGVSPEGRARHELRAAGVRGHLHGRRMRADAGLRRGLDRAALQRGRHRRLRRRDLLPGRAVTRGQMAVFLTKTFGLLLYGP